MSLSNDEEDMVDSQAMPNPRLTRAFVVGVLFAIGALVLFICGQLGITAAQYLIIATSPVYLTGYVFCKLWLAMQGIDGVAAFFIYGTGIGYALNKQPDVSIKYLAAVIGCFVLTCVAVALTALALDSLAPHCR